MGTSKKAAARAAARKARKDVPAGEVLFQAWLGYVEAASQDIIRGWWNRKVFRAIREMFNTNPRLRQAEGSGDAWNWIETTYSHYAVMLVRREVDSQSGVLNLKQLLHQLDKHYAVVKAHARGSRVPRRAAIRAHLKTLEKRTAKVVSYGHRLVAHRTPPGVPTITFHDLDDAFRAVRWVLIKYRGVLAGVDLLDTTPTAGFDWLAPYRVAWALPGFVEPEIEEESRLSKAKRRANEKQRQALGFRRYD
jgi:hypothetical protein